MNTAIDQAARQSLVQQVETDGFVALDGLCSPEFIKNISNNSHGKVREINAALGDQQIGIGSAAGFREIVQRSPGRWDIPISPQEFQVVDHDMPWWSLIADILGDDAEHSFSGVVYSEPGSPAQFWHSDSPHLATQHLPAHALNVLVALHDLPLAMGPTECARGSHKLTNHLNNTNLILDQLIYQHRHTSPKSLVAYSQDSIPQACTNVLSTGSCLVFDDRLLHRGGANQSADTRYVAYFSYRRKDYSVNTHFESQRSVYDRAD